MKLNHTTPVPNVFFDQQMGTLSGSALRVYLKIVRNLLGWRDANGNTKERDWISHSQFEKTGLSNRSVTNGVQELLSQQLITVSDYQGNDLTDPIKRKQAKRVFYALPVQNPEKTTFYNEKTKEKPPQPLLTTKEIYIPKYNANERMPDHIRYQQIKQQEELKQLERDSWL